MLDLQRELAIASTAPVILIVEDDPTLRTLLSRVLREEGFQPLSAAHGVEMARLIEANPIDLVLLDVMLPGSNGFDLCRALRRSSNVPIVILSARDDETDRLIGLELGADDYIAKPFSNKELIARIRAILRRTQAGGHTSAQPRGYQVLTFSNWTLDPGRRELVSPEGAIVDLSGAEFDLLLAFVSSPQRVIGRERLLEMSRARFADASDRSIDVLVSRLRRKLAANQADSLLRTVRGVGYIFTSAVERR